MRHFALLGTLAGSVLLIGSGARATEPSGVDDCQIVPGTPWVDFRAEPWQEILQASVCAEAGPNGTTTYTFEMILNGKIPEPPTRLPPLAQSSVTWVFGISTDGDSLYYGYPQPPGLPIPANFLLWLKYDGSKFEGWRIDRRELNTTGEVTLWDLAFDHVDDRVSTTVSDVDIDSHGSFLWHAATMDWMAPFGTEGIRFMDDAPRSSFPPQP